jgi:hypothetical protein
MPSTSTIPTLQTVALEKKEAGENGLSYWRVIHLSTAEVPEQEGL